MSLPYFEYYVKDFHAKAAHLDLAEEGAYHRLLRLCWMRHSCSIPSDEDWIFKHMRARKDTEAQEVIRSILSEFFTLKKGEYFNKKLSEIHAESNDKHSRRVNAGKKSAEKRQKSAKKNKSLKNNDISLSNAGTLTQQPEPEPEPDIITDVIINNARKEKPKKRRQKTSIKEGWRPKPLSPEMHKKLNLTQSELRHEYEKFIANCKAHNRKYANWDAAWRNWLQSDFGTYGKRIARQSDQRAKQTNAAKNRQASTGLGGAIEREINRSAEQDDQNIIDVSPRAGDVDNAFSLGFIQDD